MRRVKLVIATVVALSLLCFFTISTASAQQLDGVWFKLSARVTGYAVDPVTGEPMRGRIPVIAYLGFVWDGGAEPYNYFYAFYTEQAPGVWDVSSSGNLIPDFDSYFPDWGNLQWLGEGGKVLDFYHTVVITPAYRGLRYEGWGEVFNGDDGAGNRLYGGITITGSSIDPSRLPFPPVVPTP